MSAKHHPPTEWARVSKSRPCTICEKHDWCTLSTDGRVAVCMRIEAGCLKPTGNGGWLHKLVTDPPPPGVRTGPPRGRTSESRMPNAPEDDAAPVEDASPASGSRPADLPEGDPAKASPDWSAVATRYARALTPELRERLAVSLGLPPDGLDRIPLVGVRRDDAHADCTTWPEVNPAGEVIGVNRRWPKGTGPRIDGVVKDKMAVRGGRRGLTLPRGWSESGNPGDPVFVCEGPTDTAAMTAAGLSCVGRPSANGGAGLLAELFTPLGDCRPIVVVGENDRKEDGFWPGRQGAGQVGVRLAEMLGREVLVAMPPAGAKDAREWLTHPDRGDTSWAERGRRFAELLLDAAEPRLPPPELRPDGDDQPPERPAAPRDEPDNPHRLAEGYLRAVDPEDRARTFRCRAGEFVEWHRGAYRTLPEEDVRARLTVWMRADFLRVWEREWAEWAASADRDSEEEPVVRKVTVRLLGDVLNAVKGMVLLPSDSVPPCWIGGAAGPEPRDILAMPNGLLEIPTGRLLPPTPLFLTMNAVDFEFDPNPPSPREWLRFLNQLWPDDPESIECLREWFGYLLTQDTSLQKLLMLIGPRRAGKGTIIRVLKSLVGDRSFASPTLNGMTNEFGLSSLLNKSVAVVADARFTGRADLAGVVVERLLSITGEDPVDVNRKFLPILTVKLNARFVIVSNELPRLTDSSGALSGRMVLLRLTRTFFGAEDARLADRLLAELPGILCWALDGLNSLRLRGRFLQPASGAELRDEMDDLSSPVGAFVRERCLVGPRFRVEVGELFSAWESWCQSNHRREPGTLQTFGQQLHAAVPGVRTRRPKQNGERWREYEGLRIRRPGEGDPPVGEAAAPADPADPPAEPGPHGSSGPRPPLLHAQRIGTGQPTSGRNPDVPNPVSGSCNGRGRGPEDPRTEFPFGRNAKP